MKISEWLKSASEEFADAMIPSAGLDAEIILAHTLNKPRTWLHAHNDEAVDPRRLDIADARAQLRLERVPIAYIIGHKEFYGRRFRVTPDVLVPRPESEAMIEMLKAHFAKGAKQLVDVGTGSGCLGITAKLEFPELAVTLTDISKAALAVAEKNCDAHHIQTRIIKSDLLENYPLNADIILANLPYVDPQWPNQSPELASEPSLALYASEGGLALILALLEQASSHLAHEGIIIIEADPSQHQTIIDFAENDNYIYKEASGYAIVFKRA